MSLRLLLVYSLVSVFLQLISISSCQSPDQSLIKEILRIIEPNYDISELVLDNIRPQELHSTDESTTEPFISSYDCTTPTGQRGQCKNIRQCPAVISILTNAPRPIPQSTRQALADLGCGYEGRDPKVCCTNTVFDDRSAKQSMPDPAQPNSYYSEAPLAVEGHQNLRLLPGDCGKLKPEAGGIGFVHGGNKTMPYEFPWMALLSYNTPSGQDFQCGGTVLNERYILTAAHCITNLRGRLVLSGVRVGEHDINKEIDCEDCPPPQDYSIEEVIPHPDYVGSRLRQGSRFQHDIGLIRLARTIDLSQEYVKAICIPHQKIYREKPLDKTSLLVTGWGITEEGSASPDLLKVYLPYVGNDECGRLFNKTIGDGIGFRQLCAGGIQGIDACGGDSGGPLQYAEYSDRSLKYVQYGIVSFGPRSCGQSNVPGVYTRVSHYVKWILDTIRP